jgi:hypothetical protein
MDRQDQTVVTKSTKNDTKGKEGNGKKMPQKNTENKELSVYNIESDKFNEGDLVKWYTFYEEMIVKDAGYGIVIKCDKGDKHAPIDAPGLYDRYYVLKFKKGEGESDIAQWFFTEELELQKHNTNKQGEL